MSVSRIPILIMILTYGAISARTKTDTTGYFGFNLGFSPAKTSIGASWVKGYNQWNLGFLVPPSTYWDGFTEMVPGLTYNRQITPRNFFLSAGVYAPRSVREYGTVYIDSIAHTIKVANASTKRGWEKPLGTLGCGKVFQFRNWGIHMDADVLTPIGENVKDSWDWLFGAGISFRGILE